MIILDYGVNKNCWNHLDSYGEICVGCGCCQKDTTKRRKARLDVLKRWLEESENFDNWSDDEQLREIQEKNIADDIRYYKRKIRYYEKMLKGE